MLVIGMTMDKTNIKCERIKKKKKLDGSRNIKWKKRHCWLGGEMRHYWSGDKQKGRRV